MTLERRTPMKRSPMKRGDSQLKRVPIRKVSAKRAKVNAARRVFVATNIVGRQCRFPGCVKVLCDPHEIWTRARSGQDDHGLLCPDNVIPLCREHHDLITDDTVLGEELGLVRPSWKGCPCGYNGRNTP